MLIALVTALVIGALAQKVRICFAGSVRNIFLMRDFDLMLPIAGLFVVMVVFNLATGGFKLSFDGQPIAHSQHLWNILGLYAVGFGATLAGGCPLRQMTLAGQGSCDAAVTFVGMLIGAAFAHNFGLAALPPPLQPPRRPPSWRSERCGPDRARVLHRGAVHHRHRERAQAEERRVAYKLQAYFPSSFIERTSNDRS